MAVILAIWEAEIRRIEVRGQPRQQKQDPFSKQHPIEKRSGGVAQVVRVPA
jgi:hypothetical protein